MKLLTPGRILLGEGILMKECRKKTKQRYFILFNDILVYGTIIIKNIKYTNQHILKLNEIQLESVNDSDNPSIPDFNNL